MTDYTDPIRAAIFSVLDGDDILGELATGGVWHLRADAEAEFPYCVFNKQSGLPIRAMGTVAFVNQLWLVKGLCRGGDQGEAEAIDARCEQLLDDADPSIDGFNLLACERETDVAYAEDDSGETIFHVGAVYRIRAERL
jgi:hypothetical protein